MAQPYREIKSATRSNIKWGALGIVLLLLAGAIFDFPGYYRSFANGLEGRTGISLPRPNIPDFRLGLDLQGGAHLVYDVETAGVPASDRGDAVAGVRDVIERRVNAFGVGEPLVQTNTAGEVYRVIVELPGIVDVKEAIKQIGETPLLEFKEQNPNPQPMLTVEQERVLKTKNDAERAKAKSILATVLSNKKTFEEYAKEFSEDTKTKETGGDLGFVGSAGETWQTQLHAFAGAKGKIGAVSKDILESDIGFHIIKVEEIKEAAVSFSARHILVCFKGTERCPSERSREEALQKAQSLKTELTVDNFATRAKENSDDPGSGPQGGDLGEVRRGQTVPVFEDAAFSQSVNTISEPLETPFGFHLVYKYGEQKEKQYRIRHVLIDKTTAEEIAPEIDPWLNTILSGKQLDRASVQFNQQTGEVNVSLQFDKEGDELFAKITERNVDKPVAIFLDGEIISAPRVVQKITGGTAVITGNFTVGEAKLLAQRLNAGALPLPVKLVSQSTVGPTLGQVSLEKSLFAGLVGFALVLLFMVLYYRLPGLLAGFALLLYVVLVLAIFKVVPVTLTLAGIAGFILSMGMAVDANVLIFERVKEELRDGHNFTRAIPLGFERAWTSIRDSNVTTLITCAVLFWFGTSVVRGFAVTLAIGVIVSMFSAITITRILLRFIEPWIKEGTNLVLGAKKRT